MAAELTPGGVDSACPPSEVGEMSTSVLVKGHSISGTAMLPRNGSYLAAKLPYTRTEQLVDALKIPRCPLRGVVELLPAP